jgi:hypothetical protein
MVSLLIAQDTPPSALKIDVEMVSALSRKSEQTFSPGCLQYLVAALEDLRPGFRPFACLSYCSRFEFLNYCFSK